MKTTIATVIAIVCVDSGMASAQNTALTASGRPGKGLAWGYLGDGTGVMDAKPPLQFDGNKPVWKTPLPAWGLSSPIVVKERVFVVCEPSRDLPWPQLVCLAAADGKELWRGTLNHLPATGLNADAQEKAAHHWSEFWRKFFVFLDAKARVAGNPSSKDAAIEELKSKGLVLKNGLENLDTTDLDAVSGKYSPLKASALTMDTWALWGKIGAYMIGEAFATPVSDGDYVYAVTAWGGFFCYDLDGKLKWMKHYPGNVGEYCRNGRSPILWRNLLLSDTTALMRAIDKATGELKWSSPDNGDCYITPTVIKLSDGGEVVLCANGEAFSLPDGKKLTVKGVGSFGCVALPRQDQPDTVLFLGGDEHGGWARDNPPPPMMVRFSREGGQLNAQVLWDGKQITRGGGQQAGIAMSGDKVYHRYAGILDATNGTWMVRCGKGALWPRAVPQTGHLLYIAAGHIVGLGQENPPNAPPRLHYYVCTLDGKPVADSVVPDAGNYSCAFTISGKRAYIRSSTHLICYE